MCQGIPTSVSMPLALAEHANAKIDPYLWGLLPDNAQILDRWARKFHVSARNAFGLVVHVGEDAPGAVQFVPPERVDHIRRGSRADVQWLDEAMIAQRLKALRVDHAAWRLPSDTGQFSLAGAQPKTALLFVNGRWGLPSGRVPTTHILKPPTGDFDGHTEMNTFAWNWPAPWASRFPTLESRDFRAKLPSSSSATTAFKPLPPSSSAFHQEDICQGMAIPPTRKYQSEGGPGVRQIADFLKTYSTRAEEDVRIFADALAFNWLIAGTDAHAKNYAVLIGSGGTIRLAPLYDLASVLPYPDFDPRRIRLAMKIGREYRLREIGRRQWQKAAGELRLDPDFLVARVRELVDFLSESVPEVAKRLHQEGLRHPILTRLVKALTERANDCKKILRT